MFIIGLIDDWREFSPFLKLFAEGIPTFLAIIFGIHTSIIYFPPFLNLIFSFLWILVVTNAINMLDIKDGLALGIIMICLSFFLILGVIKNDMGNFLLIAVFLGASIGIFIFNFPKAKLYLGDNGSLSLGFFLAVMAINFSYAKETTPFCLLTPVVILGLPLFDFSYVTLRRFVKKKSIFQKSQDHLAILMEKRGFKRNKILVTLWGLCFLFGISALAIQFAPFSISVLSFTFVFLLCIVIGLKFSKP
jgi:UDP-GlcNAc:undecaprenyl-phosphate GlcNAc-1-phosphate transferase